MTDRLTTTALLLLCGLAAGCTTTPFQPQTVEESAFLGRAMEQQDSGIQVRAAVPTAEETQDLLGLDLYAKGIQPVWLDVTNGTDSPARVALFSVDNEYYSPMEVAWYYRKDIRKSDQPDLKRWFYEHQMTRRIPPGESRSGFVFTHAMPGTKGFNLDVYSRQRARHFTFFVPMPGFTADHDTVDFRNLYSSEEINLVDRDGLLDYLSTLGCCSTDASGEQQGEPLNVALVGSANALRRALLRGDWEETQAGGAGTVQARKHYFRGRVPDVTLHKSRPDGTERKELRLWLAPLRYADVAVWVGQASYDMSGGKGDKAYENYQVDPDVDDAMRFLLQNIWYNQSLLEARFLDVGPASTIEDPAESFDGSSYFTNGARLVLFISEIPIPFDEAIVNSFEDGQQ